MINYIKNHAKEAVLFTTSFLLSRPVFIYLAEKLFMTVAIIAFVIHIMLMITAPSPDGYIEIPPNNTNSTNEIMTELRLYTITLEHHQEDSSIEVEDPIILLSARRGFAATEDVTEVEPEPELIYGRSLGTYSIYAYCNCVRCCGRWSPYHSSRIGTNYTHKTASGTIPTINRTVAADWSVLKPGTQIIVDGILYTVEDRGTGIHGRKLDVYFGDWHDGAHENALQHGIQRKEVFMLGEQQN